MSSAPGGKWRNVSAEAAKRWGFTVDSHCYPWVIYKGPRFAPTEWHYIKTDEELAARERRQANSRESAARLAEAKANPVCHTFDDYKEHLLDRAERAVSVEELRAVVVSLVKHMS